jgi:hypothetical protein
MQKHERYEELCALAATEQLSAEEQQLLNEHLSTCEDCRMACEEFSALLREWPVTDETEALIELRKAEGAGYRQRFLTRATREGRRFSENATRGDASARLGLAWPPFSVVKQWAIGAAAASLLVGGVSYAIVRTRVHAAELAARKSTTSPNETRQYQPQPALLETGVTDRARPAASTSASQKPTATAQLEAQLAELQQRGEAASRNIAQLKTENSTLLEHLQTSDRNLRASAIEKEQLQSALDRANDLNDKLDQRGKENEALLAQTRGDLEKLRAEHSHTTAGLVASQREVDDLSRRLQAQGEGLDRERDLLAEGRDIRDLMGARNLHIIDVYDSDPKGKNRKSFGRVFFTEGKSLIFYAFDLDQGRTVDAKYSFEAWGERLGQPTSVKNLGVFFFDDKTQRRWVLKLDDPAQIAQIDSVFVTLEPNGANSPRGKKILYAFLGGGPNHP